MKTPRQKSLIREMLRAEGLRKPTADAPDLADWQRFKAEMRTQMQEQTVPELLLHAPRKTPVWVWRLAPVAAFLIMGLIFQFWYHFPQNKDGSRQADTNVEVTAKKPMREGDVWKHGKNRIDFTSGHAQLTMTDAAEIEIETVILSANFSLPERVKLQIRHPLVLVTVTGTEFALQASENGGSIDLRKGSLRIRHSSAHNETRLKAPGRFVFSETSYKVITREKSRAHQSARFHYQLMTGEMLYARQLHTDERIHRIELSDGSVRTLRVNEIAGIQPADD